MKIGIQGVPGAYSDVAAHRFFAGQDIQTTECHHFSELVQSLSDRQIDYAVIPVENSTTGMVNRSIDHIRYKDIYASKELFIPIQHALIGQMGATREDVQYVYSHPEALSQCELFFQANKDLHPLSYDDTAKAVAYVKGLGDKQNAAIASEFAADIYGMQVLAREIQDSKQNHTRFLLFSKEEPVIRPNHKMTLYFEVPHESGSLVKILNIFSIADINLVNLVSRPTSNLDFTYGFFVEIEVPENLEEFNNVLEWIKLKTAFFRMVGVYPSGQLPNQTHA